LLKPDNKLVNFFGKTI